MNIADSFKNTFSNFRIEWSVYRRAIYIIGILFLIIGLVVYLFRDSIFPAPTCFDNIQNQNERGVDCGGACSLVCSFDHQPLSVNFSKAFKRGEGVYDVLILIKNDNLTAAPKTVNLSIDMYNASGTLVFNIKDDILASTGQIIPIVIDNVKLPEINACEAIIAAKVAIAIPTGKIELGTIALPNT